MMHQNNVESPFAGFRAYSPSPERDPRNNIKNNCWLKAIPPKANIESIGSKGYSKCNYCCPPGTGAGNINIQPGSQHPPAVHNAPGYQTATGMATPKPRPCNLAPANIGRTLEQWELGSTVSDASHCDDDDNDDDDRVWSSECLLELIRRDFSQTYGILYNANFELESMEVKLDVMRECMERMNVNGYA
ncbi:hypothetical protein DTO271G3_6970 [Paecilomyces variotii]|nr:hypothetical protein DTO271G3_6970 [Paecilomyces variotii]